MSKIYARQISPEYQESPLFLFDEWPENLVLTGNRDFNSHTIPAFDKIADDFNNMAEDWENLSCRWIYENGAYRKIQIKPEISLAALLREWGFNSPAGKPWTTKQRHQWRELMERDEGAEEPEIMLAALELLTGAAWETRTLRGSCQSEWQECFYMVDAWSREALEEFETEYFNLGSEWIIHDEDEEPETAEEINGFSTYCTAWDDDGIKKQIADVAGGSAADVVLFAWAGYRRENVYREV